MKIEMYEFKPYAGDNPERFEQRVDLHKRVNYIVNYGMSDFLLKSTGVNIKTILDWAHGCGGDMDILNYEHEICELTRYNDEEN